MIEAALHFMGVALMTRVRGSQRCRCKELESLKDPVEWLTLTFWDLRMSLAILIAEPLHIISPQEYFEIDNEAQELIIEKFNRKFPSVDVNEGETGKMTELLRKRPEEVVEFKKAGDEHSFTSIRQVEAALRVGHVQNSADSNRREENSKTIDLESLEVCLPFLRGQDSAPLESCTPLPRARMMQDYIGYF